MLSYGTKKSFRIFMHVNRCADSSEELLGKKLFPYFYERERHAAILLKNHRAGSVVLIAGTVFAFSSNVLPLHN